VFHALTMRQIVRRGRCANVLMAHAGAANRRSTPARGSDGAVTRLVFLLPARNRLAREVQGPVFEGRAVGAPTRVRWHGVLAAGWHKGP
jgi:hypothetical protein